MFPFLVHILINVVLVHHDVVLLDLVVVAVLPEDSFGFQSGKSIRLESRV